MKYERLRSSIQSGDLIAFTHRAWRSVYDIKVQLVRFFTQSEFSHVGIAFVIDGRVFIIESITGGVRIHSLSDLIPFWHVSTFAPWKPETQAFALSLVGKPYSQLGAIRAFLNKDPERTLDRMWCSKLAQLVLEKDGVIGAVQQTPSAVVYAAQERDGSRTTLVE
jgi:hypothetical protein